MSEYDDPADVIEISFNADGTMEQQRYTESPKVRRRQSDLSDDEYSEPIRRPKTKKTPPPKYESEVNVMF